MKSLQQHLNESLVNEAYKAQFKPADWDGVSDWIDNMIEGGVQDTPEN